MPQPQQIIRTQQQIEDLIRRLKEELEGEWLNDESRTEARSWLVELGAGLQGKILDPWSEAGYWLWNEKGILGKDYGVE